eukprot:m.42893 g.42893  ORF g.42893 m.42893 type:complete len:397 (+) comp9925_c0_seq1:140-1330(+)
MMIESKLIFLVLLFVSVNQISGTPPADMATAVYLTDYPNAKCLDGSPGYYYIRQAPKGGVNSSKWVMHIQGGGWCDSEDRCLGRTTTYLGTSNKTITKYSDVSDFADVKCDEKSCGALMFNDPSVNELAHDWNAVFLRYCDGMSFASNMSQPHHKNGTNEIMWFRGLEILHGTFASLTQKYNLGEATFVITNGASAGGLATYLHADTMTDLIHDANAAASKSPAHVVSLPDSGFWPDEPSKRFSAMFRNWFALQGNITDGLPKHCKWAEINVTRCLFPQYFADEIQTRLFPLQSLYDPLQNFANGSNHNTQGDWLQTNMNRTIFTQKSSEGLPNGGFVYSCSRHCGGELLRIDGYTAVTALETLIAPNSPRSLFLNHVPYPCQACCNDPPYPPTMV